MMFGFNNPFKKKVVVSKPVNAEIVVKSDETPQVMKEVAPAKHVTVEGGRKTIYEQVIHIEKVIIEEQIKFVPKYVDVPYDEYVFEEVSDEEGDIHVDIPVNTDQETQVVYYHPLVRDADQVVPYHEIVEKPYAQLIDDLVETTEYHDIVNERIVEDPVYLDVEIPDKKIAVNEIRQPV